MSVSSPRPACSAAKLCFALLLASCLAPQAAADIITLKNGQRIEGCVTAQDETVLTIKTEGGEVIVKNEDLYSRVAGEELLLEYENRAKRVTSRTADQFGLARWCKIHCLEEQMKAHATKVLEKTPANEPARAMLGHTKDASGAWITADGQPDPFLNPPVEEPSGDNPSRRHTSGAARSPEKEFRMRWERVDKTSAKELLALAYFCRSEELKDDMIEVLRALFLIVPDDAEGLQLAESMSIDRAMIQTAGMSEVTFLELRPDGKQVLGKIVEDDGATVTLEIEGIGNIEFPTNKVAKRKLLTLEEKEYYEKHLALKPADGKGHLALAQWCLEKGLTSYAREQAEIVIGIDKDSAEARKILGHEKVDGRWIAVGGGQNLDDIDENSGDWRRRKRELEQRCKTLTQLIATGSEEEKKSAIAEALEMRNPYAVPIIFDVLVKQRTEKELIEKAKTALVEIQSLEILQLVEGLPKSKEVDLIRDGIEVLSRMKNGDSAEVLVSYLVNVDSVHHDLIFKGLEEVSSPAVDKALLKGLRDTVGHTKGRIIGLCGTLRSEATVGTLMGYLTDRHPFIDPAFAALVQIGFPGVPKLIESLKVRELRKQTVKVLREITGETIPISYPRWKEWWDTYTGG